MGNFSVWPLASGSAAGGGGAPAPPSVGTPCCGMAMGDMAGAIIIGGPANWRVMRTLSSPSVISISPMPDSWTRSMSFFSFLRSMKPFLARCAGHGGGLLANGAQGGLQRELVAQGAEAADHAGRDVREIRVLAERLAGVDVGQVHFDEGNPDAGQRVAKGN